MKNIELVFILTLLSLLASCDSEKFRYKKNPAYVLNETFNAIQNMDQTSFGALSGKEAKCIYDNDDGMAYLKENLDINLEEIKLNPKMVETRHFSAPIFVGYWSYYHERYEIEVESTITNSTILNVVVDCEFGTEFEKDSRLINLKPSKYKMKECKLVKIEPKSFEGLPLKSECGLLTVNL